jgi:hypothetical protein
MVIIVELGTILVNKAKFQNGHLNINIILFTLKIGSFTAVVKSVYRIQF